MNWNDFQVEDMKEVRRVAAWRTNVSCLCVLLALFILPLPAMASGHFRETIDWAWWVWPLLLFGMCFLLGIVAVPAGVGGGVLFVPIVGGLFPFHFDFVRAAGLLVALASALSAVPSLLRLDLANLRLAMPMALLASMGSIGGALIGFALPTQVVQVVLGITILSVVILMARSTEGDDSSEKRFDALSEILGLYGVYLDSQTNRSVCWRAHNTIAGLVVFTGIGALAGMLGMGAGWANVPTLTVVMGVPLKVAAGTSSLILSLVDSTASWVYIHRGAILPILVVPSMCGMMLGARIGVKLLVALKASAVRKLVLALLVFSGIRALLKGCGL
jgi:uncharacterized membrane protein YfcA